MLMMFKYYANMLNTGMLAFIVIILTVGVLFFICFLHVKIDF